MPALDVLLLQLANCRPASKKHIGLYPGPEAVEAFKEELKNYSVDKGTMHKLQFSVFGKILSFPISFSPV